MALKNKDVLSIIKSFLDGTAKEWDWDDFISVPMKNQFLEEIRKECASLPEEFPTNKKGQYCNDEGVKVLKKYILALEERIKQEKNELEIKGK